MEVAMLRDKNLIPLSHQHQHALALCVRLDRALKSGPAEIGAWQEEMAQAFQDEIRYHFEAEERILFPAAKKHPGLGPLIRQLLGEHAALRKFFAAAREKALDSACLRTFTDTLANHVRTEERELFEQCQQVMSAEELGRIGAAMLQYFAHSGMPGATCSLPPSGRGQV